MIRRIFFVYFIILLVTSGISAETTNSIRRDSMRAYYDKYLNDPTDPNVLTAADTLLQMARKDNDELMTKLAMGAKLDYYYYGSGEHRTDSVIVWVNRIKNYAQHIDNPELYFWAWSTRLVNHYIKQGEYNISLLEAKKMLQEAEKSKNQAIVAECYAALANIYTAKGLMNKALEFMLKEIEVFEENDIIRYHIALQYSDAAKIYMEQREKSKALELLQKGLIQAKSPYHIVTVKLAYVSLYLSEDNIPAATQMLEECRDMYKTEPSLKRHIHYFYDVEIDYYRKTKNYAAALHVLEQREKELKQSNDLVEVMALEKARADILWTLNRKEEAAAIYRDYIEKQEKQKEKTEEITTGEFATMLNVQQLNAEKKELEKISKEKELQNIRIVLISLAVALCIVVFFLSKQRILNRKLKKSRDKLDEKNRILIEAEEELRKAKDLAEENSRLKTVFIQNMSHEIRTPLNSIVGFSAVLADLFTAQEEVKQYASLIEDNSKVLLKLISDILDISALDDDLEMKISPTDINSCCYQAMDVTKPFFDDNVRLIFKPACEELNVNSNHDRIVQVLENLLNNASKFTREGSVTLAYEVKKETNQIVFTVTDTGIGIPHKLQERVFERFVKLDDFSQGTGLGLPISRIIAERLGGSLLIDKDYTEGTRFIFSVRYSG